MRYTTRHCRFLAIAVLALLWGTNGPTMAGSSDVNRSRFGRVAIKGYDPVIFHTQKEALEGSAKFRFEWKGAFWWFRAEGNRHMFALDPLRFAPQFGGFCAAAMAEGLRKKIDPQFWKIVDGRLYLFKTEDAMNAWVADSPRQIASARAAWAKLLEAR